MTEVNLPIIFEKIALENSVEGMQRVRIFEALVDLIKKYGAEEKVNMINYFDAKKKLGLKLAIYLKNEELFAQYAKKLELNKDSVQAVKNLLNGPMAVLVHDVKQRKETEVSALLSRVLSTRYAKTYVPVFKTFLVDLAKTNSWETIKAIPTPALGWMKWLRS